MNIVSPFLETVKLREDAVAFHCARSSWRPTVTFRELSNASNGIAERLLAHGLKKGDTVILIIPVSPELYAVLLALFRLGLVAVVLDPSAGDDHLQRCLSIIPPDALIAIPKGHILRLGNAGLRRIPKSFALGGWFPLARALPLNSGSQGDEIIENLTPDAPALITFTSGSTGIPKATVHTHQFLIDQHLVLEKNIQLQAGQVDLVTLPIFGLANLASGLTSVLPDCDMRQVGAIEPGPVLEQIDTFQITRTAASPAFLQRLVKHPDAARLGSSLRGIYTGGAPVFPRLLRTLKETWPESEPVAVYGSTESEPIAHAAWSKFTPADLRSMENGNGLLAGHPVPEIQIALLREPMTLPTGPFSHGEFRVKQCGVGTPGEIVVTGNHVLKGYYEGRGDEETKFSIKGQVWHRTGDMGKWDEQGRLWLLGRCSSWIQDERGELSPFAVECVVMNEDWVAMAGCLQCGGRRVLAVSAKAGNPAGDLEALKQRLSWAHLDKVVVLPQLPVDKRHNAKIDYVALRKILEAS